MVRPRKPWYWKARKGYYVTIDGAKVFLAHDRAAALEAFRRLERAETPGTSTESLAGVIELFLDEVKRHRAKRTYETYRDVLKRVATYFGYDLPASHLTPRMVAEWLDKQDWSRSYKGQVVRTLRCCYRWGEGQSIYDRSPLASLRGYAVEARDNLVSPAHYRAILAHSKTEFRLLVAFAAETGARVNEIRIIEAQWIDDDRVVIPKQFAKGKRAPRIIYLTEKATRIARRLCRRYPTGPIFRNEDGNPWTAGAIACRFARLVPKIGHRYSLGDFRHTWVHLQLASGQDALTIATLAGHSNPTMVANTYGKLTYATEHLRKAVRRKKELD